MRQFVLQILLLTGVSTIAVVLIGSRMLGGTTLSPSSDAGDVVWFCYEERLMVTAPGPVRGQSHLCHGDRSVKISLDAASLTPGEIYTAWLAYIEAPGSCTATPCPLLDFLRLDQPPLVSRLDATVADDTRQATFAATLRGLVFASGSQVQVLLSAHGPAAVGDRRAYQLLAARWPERDRGQSGDIGIVARSHFTMRWAQD